jgi:hypothetical protein
MRRKYSEKNLVASSCIVIDVHRNRAVVKTTETGKKTLIAETVGVIKNDDRVDIFEVPSIDKVTEVLIYTAPAYFLVLSFAIGFIFGNSLYHYLFMLTMTLLGFVQLILTVHYAKKLPSRKYVALLSTGDIKPRKKRIKKSNTVDLQEKSNVEDKTKS